MSGGEDFQKEGAGKLIRESIAPKVEEMSVDLEDHYEDVLNKAMRGTGMESATLGFLSGVREEAIEALRGGDFNEEALGKVCPPLGLDAGSLIELARKEWKPEEVKMVGLEQFTTDFDEEMTVNSYLVWDEETREAALFDTGAVARPALEKIAEAGLNLGRVFLTHTHHDHIIDLSLVREAWPEAEVLVNGREAIKEAGKFQVGQSFQVGQLEIETRLTRGHSPAGTTYVVAGLERPVAIVGDALFAQSMGGGVISYEEALATNRKEIFSLPDETVVCPGHGPMSSVGEEKAHNPFFPEFK